MMKRFSFFILFLILLNPICGYSANKKAIEEKLKSISETIKQRKEDYNKIRSQYLTILKQISNTDKRITFLKSKIKRTKRDLDLLNKKIATLKKEIDKVSLDLERQKEKLYRELVSYYEYSKVSNYYAKGVWYSYMNRFITSYMQQKIKNYISKREYLKERIAKLNAYMVQKQKIMEKIKSQQRDLDTQKATLSKLAEMAENKKKQYLAEIQQLTKQRENLKELLKKIIEEEKKKRESRKLKVVQKVNPKLVEKEFKALAHKIKPPVYGKVVAYFGRKYDPVFKVYTRNDGIDIRAKKGSCIRTIAYGKVGFVGDLPGYGGVVIINHLNGYYTVYAGLKSSLRVGQIVKAYQCIGRLSSTKLHFEIRRHATPVNPLYFLDRRFLR
ncbi:murein hydrolase activator EnvC family protein [Hippea alviniae]|uniref:murein hydrolase activator EnvC family protein n=1 Tax=Hippea alviniae TaxID=1279027 RepID=UPI0009DBE134|nr:peptidoglycan DD-metalloendopeptidase family protein [Hippea alviniae]